MLPILKDPRYIRVQGAPLLLIYRVNEFPDPVASAEALRAAAAKHGIPNIHLVATQSFGVGDPRFYGLDAAAEFPPHVNRRLLDPHKVGGVYSRFDGHVEDYVGVANESINVGPPQYVRYRGCVPMWDNTARWKSRAHILVNDSPKAYGRWLRFLVEEAMLRRDQIEPLIFINAWNEWGEGTYLEPDENYGRALLEVTRAALAHGVADYALGGRHRVIMPFDFDVIIEADLAFLPFRIDVGLDRQRLEGGAFDLIEQCSPAGSEVPRHARIELRDEITNGSVNLGKREEALMRSLAMIQRVGRFIEARLGDARSQIVGNDLRRDPAEECEGSHVRADPVHKTLREGGFRIGVVRCAQRGDEQLADAHFTGRTIERKGRVIGNQ
jgi:hypothetical protein